MGAGRLPTLTLTVPVALLEPRLNAILKEMSSSAASLAAAIVKLQEPVGVAALVTVTLPAFAEATTKREASAQVNAPVASFTYSLASRVREPPSGTVKPVGAV